MSNDLDLASLLAAIGGSAEAEPAASDFGQQLQAALEQSLAYLRSEGLVEVVEGHEEQLSQEVTAAGLDARSPKQLMKRVVYTLIESDHVEEVYGTDDELFACLRRFLDPEG